MSGNGDVNVRITATDEASEKLRGLSDGAVKFGAVVGAAAKATEMLVDTLSQMSIGGIKQAIADADKLYDMSQKLGMGVQQLAAYKLAAEQSGTTLEGVAQGVKSLSTQMLKHGEAFKKIGIDTQDSDKAFRQLADVFANMPDGMEKAALAVKLFGRSGMELIPTLNLGSKGLDESAQKAEKYAASMALLAPEADRLNDRLTEMQIASQAAFANMAVQAAPALNEIATAMAIAANEAGMLEAAMVGIGGATQAAIDAVLTPIEMAFKQVKAEMLSFAAKFDEWRASILFGSAKQNALRSSMENNLEAAKLYGEIANWNRGAPKRESEIPTVSSSDVQRLAAYNAGLNITTDAAREIAKTYRAAGMKDVAEQIESGAAAAFLKQKFGAKEAVKSVNDAVDEYAKLMTRLNAKDVGLDASYWKDLETLHKQYLKTGDIEAYRDAVAKLTNQQKFAQDIVKAAADAEKAYADAAKKAAEEIERSLSALEDKAQAAEDELANYGKTKSEIEETIIARLEERKAMYAASEGNEVIIAQLEREIDARQRAADAMRGIEAKDAAKKAAEDSAKAWENFSRDIERSLTDSLMRAFESGESFGETFVKSLQNTLKSTVLKVAVQAIVNPVTGGIQSALGIGGSAGNALSGVSGLSSAWSAFSGGTTATLGGLIGGEFGAGMAGAYLAPGLAGPTTLGASGAMGAGATFGAALPWIGGALAVASLLGAFDSGGGPKTEGGLVGTIGGSINELSSTGQKFYTGNGSDDYVRQYLTPLMADLDKLAQELGGNASGLELGLGFNSDPQGTSGDSVGGGVYKDGQQAYFHAFGGYARGSYATELATESKRVMLAALESLDLNDLADAYLDSLDIAGLTDEMASQSLALVATTDDIIAAFEKVGFSASDVTLDLINAMGGFDAAGQAVSAMSQALDQIAQSAASSSSVFQNSIRDIELSVLDNPGKYNYLDEEAARYRDVLASLSDPALIAEYAGRLNDTIMQAWGTLDGTQQQAKSDEFISLLREADTLALSRYDVAKENVTAQAEAIAAAVKQAVAEAMAENVAASNAVVTAVNNGIDAHVSVNLTIDQIRGAEVGYAA